MNHRYFIYLQYDGTQYHGWQTQPNAPSVQQTIEEALALILRNEIPIVGAGRTDTGVHARLMVAHFDLAAPLSSPSETAERLNRVLPHDIAIDRIVPVKPDAHARFDALSRSYEYTIVTKKSPFERKYATKVHGTLDFEAMNQAARQLLLYTDFTSFSKLHTDVKTNNCKVTQAEWIKRGDTWVFCITADRFLRNMVRAIVGTLLDVGRGKMNIDQFREVIEIKDRCRAGSSAPAEGLALIAIGYPDYLFDVEENRV